MMQSTTQDRITIFDIPHLVESISSHLCFTDIWATVRVSRTWHAHFRRFLWHTVCLTRNSSNSSPTTLSPQQASLIRQNSHSIRWLRLLEVDQTLVSGATPITCTRLAYLSCVDHAAYISGDETNARREALPSALSLIQHNTRLRTLRLTCTHRTYDAFQTLFLPYFSGLVLLNSFGLNFYAGFRMDLVEEALKRCPDSLQSLDLQLFPSDDDGTDFRITPRLNPDLATEVWKPFLNLATLSVQGGYVGDWEWILLPLLKYTPAVQDLLLPSISQDNARNIMTDLGTLCPRLKFVHLNSDDEYSLEDPMEASLFSELKQSLQRVNVDITMDPSKEVIKTLLKTSTTTLTHLFLENSTIMSSQDVVSLLTGFPHLVDLRMNEVYQGGDPLVYVYVQDLIRVEWVCTKIQSIQLTISDARDSTEGEEGEGWETPTLDPQAETCRLVLALFRKLRVLTELNNFDVSWSSPLYRMWLEEGLGYVGGEMSASDVVRMKLNWQPLAAM